jgi:anti-sigma regulatory factor (Ser/Thr protein kinase)
VLVASELVTNAVVHTQGPLGLRLEWRQEWLCVAVSDWLLRLAAEPGDLTAEGGRGLPIVDQLANRWRVQHRPGAARSSGASLT